MGYLAEDYATENEQCDLLLPYCTNFWWYAMANECMDIIQNMNESNQFDIGAMCRCFEVKTPINGAKKDLMISAIKSILKYHNNPKEQTWEAHFMQRIQIILKNCVPHESNESILCWFYYKCVSYIKQFQNNKIPRISTNVPTNKENFQTWVKLITYILGKSNNGVSERLQKIINATRDMFIYSIKQDKTLRKMETFKIFKDASKEEFVLKVDKAQKKKTQVN